MADTPAHIRLTQAMSVAVLTTASGLNLGLSFFLMPRLLESPTPLMLRQWGNMFKVSSKVLPPALMVPGFVNAYLAYKLPGKARLYWFAAALALSIGPFTWTFILPINKKLLAKVEDVKTLDMAIGDVLGEEMGAKEETGHALIDQWGFLNLYRGSAALIAGCIGLYAALS
jgi:hypothetical protein